MSEWCYKQNMNISIRFMSKIDNRPPEELCGYVYVAYINVPNTVHLSRMSTGCASFLHSIYYFIAPPCGCWRPDDIALIHLFKTSTYTLTI